MPNPTDEISVALLRRLAEAPQASQRELARDTGVSLGKLNYALRALIDQGWVKAGNFGRNQDKLSYAYLLTPAGIEAKARLTRAFLARKMAEYDRLRAQIEDLKAEIGDGRFRPNNYSGTCASTGSSRVPARSCGCSSRVRPSTRT